MCQVVLIPVITHHKPVTLYCIITLWNKRGNLLLWQVIYPLILTKLQCWSRQACGLSLHLIALYYKCTSSWFLSWWLWITRTFCRCSTYLLAASYLAVCNGFCSFNTVCMFVNYWITLHDNTWDICFLLIYYKKYTKHLEWLTNSWISNMEFSWHVVFCV